jgi:O-methyltransferase involved in polyketide biosynthesis/acyl-coenzyme A thioesterase PaaI-like protein
MSTLKLSRETEAWCKPLKPEPDLADLRLHAVNMAPAHVTRRIQELVPLLAFTGSEATRIERGMTEWSVPLAGPALNQNGTHQASVFYLLADYTVGVAMVAALPGVYVTGVHDRCPALPVQLWLKRGLVRHLAPATGPMTSQVEISEEEAKEMRRALIEKGHCEFTGIVRFHQDATRVATAETTIGLYVDLPRAVSTQVNRLQIRQAATSALMIAGFRTDPISRDIAAGQGEALAGRIGAVVPQMGNLVGARTRDVERLLTSRASTHPQVLVLGVGLDPKPVQHSTPGQRWFGVDLAESIEDRNMRFARVGAQAKNFVTVPADLGQPDWTQSLLDAGFDPTAPTLVVLEGVAMYFLRDDLAALLLQIRSVLRHPESRLWLDHVTPGVFHLDRVEVSSFLSTMTRLGEPFLTGFVDVAELGAVGWATEFRASAADYFGREDELYSHYCFTILAPAE